MQIFTLKNKNHAKHTYTDSLKVKKPKIKRRNKRITKKKWERLGKTGEKKEKKWGKK